VFLLGSLLTLAAISGAVPSPDDPPAEALAGFDNETNGFLSPADFAAAMEVFAEREEIDDGLGPVFNAQACAECHQSPVTGGISQVTELRAGRLDGHGNFVNPPGGSLINDRAIHARIQEFVPAGHPIRTFRTSLNTLGDGFVECIADETLKDIARNQPFGMKGEVIEVPVSEAGGILRVARFGWKNQHASLVSFSADAYLNEMGITSPLQPVENTSLGRSVADFDAVPEPEDDGVDVQKFADFMRSTKVPPRDPLFAALAIGGPQLFERVGCATCHVSSIVTAPPGTIVNGGMFTVPPALGNKVIHPFSDFLLHDVGTGDGILQNGPDSTRNKLRTPPLWGVRTRTRLMHDGESLTFEDAILRHGGEAEPVTRRFKSLGPLARQQLILFLKSL
jgi:CxxC motif-containing protein (DUF1111 family)